MAGQSLAMGEAFGKGFQYGKRKISSMSNEEFNALDFKGLSESIATDYKVMIPSITKSIEASDELQRAVFKALAAVIKDIPAQILDFFATIGGDTTTQPKTQDTSLVLANMLSELTLVRSGGGLGQADGGVNVNQGAIDQLEKDIKALLNPFQSGKPARDQSESDRLAQERLVAAARARTAEEAKRKTEENALRAVVARTGVVTSRRRAGQSQIQERNRLVQAIAAANKTYQTAFNRRGSFGVGPAQVALNAMRALQAKLTILLQRYIF